MPALVLIALVALVVLMPRKALGYIAGKPVELELVAIAPGKYLSAPAAHAFKRMQDAARAAGVVFQVNSAFRTMAQQMTLWQAYLAGGNLAAEPGFSNHQNGIAVDIESAGGTNAAFKWLTANAHRFGFKRTVSSEPWHWEYSA